MTLANGKMSDVEALENMPLWKLTRHIDNYTSYVERRNKAIESSSKRS